MLLPPASQAADVELLKRLWIYRSSHTPHRPCCPTASSCGGAAQSNPGSIDLHTPLTAPTALQPAHVAELLEAALRPLSATSLAVPVGSKGKGSGCPPAPTCSSSAAGTLLRNLCRSAPTLLAPLAPRLAHLLIIAAGSGAAGRGDGGKALGSIPHQQGVRQGKASAQGKAGKTAAMDDDPMDLGLGTQVRMCACFGGGLCTQVRT